MVRFSTKETLPAANLVKGKAALFITNYLKLKILNLLLVGSVAHFIVSCSNSSEQLNEKQEIEEPLESTINFQDEVEFLRRYTNIIVLESPNKGMVAISEALQGRVMTSTASGDEGRSYGWINRELFESGDTLDHINAFGGEERFWLGPEGGQFSIFHGKGGTFELDNWYVPRLLDLEPFEIAIQTESKVVFTKSASLGNYSGTRFKFDIERTVEILDEQVAYESLGVKPYQGLKQVAYQTTNILTNKGKYAWEKQTGLLSIWLLGMFNHSPYTVVVVPFYQGEEDELGPIVNDTYFGKVPSDRLKIGNGVIYFKADGKYRSKIGLSPMRAKNVICSYDYKNQILTIVKYSKPKEATDYVNSLWEIQKEPFQGDVVNSYNDGPPEPGSKPLGPFYELESSSPAAALKPGESIKHIQQTLHLEGDKSLLNEITTKVLGVSVAEIEEAFEE